MRAYPNGKHAWTRHIHACLRSKRTRRGEHHGHSLLGLQCKLVMGNVLGRLSQRTPAWALFSFGLAINIDPNLTIQLSVSIRQSTCSTAQARSYGMTNTTVQERAFADRKLVLD